MNEELKPCPFCGAKAKIWATNYRVYIQCSEFNAPRGHLVQISAKSEPDARAIWNMREEECTNE